MSGKRHVIKSVKENSIAMELELEPGDVILAIDDQEIEDIFDYQMLCESEYLVVLCEKKNGEQWELEIEKDPDEDLGITFEQELMDNYRSCCNKCIFCFIDQNPLGMRDTIYFKDDDTRLSFIQGNYVTLTNLSDKDVSRIIRYNLAPMNISVQTMNPELRCMMLHNRFAGEKLKIIDRFYENDIEMNGQIVLCKGVNDKDELKFTLDSLVKYAPVMKSVSVVPAGLTKYREGLYPLEPFTKEDAIEVIDLIESYHEEMVKKFGIHLFHASDEWYILAERQIPGEESYDGYIQLENGVGMIRLFLNEAKEELDGIAADNRKINISLFTGKLAYDSVNKVCEMIESKFPNVTVHRYMIENEFYGPSITVTGLITGGDIVKQLKGKELGDKLMIPSCTLKSGERVFLDDMTVDDVESNLQIESIIVKSSGADFVRTVLGEGDIIEAGAGGRYEL